MLVAPGRGRSRPGLKFHGRLSWFVLPRLRSRMAELCRFGHGIRGGGAALGEWILVGPEALKKTLALRRAKASRVCFAAAAMRALWKSKTLQYGIPMMVSDRPGSEREGLLRNSGRRWGFVVARPAVYHQGAMIPLNGGRCLTRHYLAPLFALTMARDGKRPNGEPPRLRYGCFPSRPRGPTPRGPLRQGLAPSRCVTWPRVSLPGAAARVKWRGPLFLPPLRLSCCRSSCPRVDSEAAFLS